MQDPLLSAPAFLKFKAVYGWELLDYQELAEGVKARARTGVSTFERNFERKMKRYHCTIVQSVVS